MHEITVGGVKREFHAYFRNAIRVPHAGGDILRGQIYEDTKGRPGGPSGRGEAPPTR